VFMTWGREPKKSFNRKKNQKENVRSIRSVGVHSPLDLTSKKTGGNCARGVRFAIRDNVQQKVPKGIDKGRKWGKALVGRGST